MAVVTTSETASLEEVLVEVEEVVVVLAGLTGGFCEERDFEVVGEDEAVGFWQVVATTRKVGGWEEGVAVEGDVSFNDGVASASSVLFIIDFIRASSYLFCLSLSALLLPGPRSFGCFFSSFVALVYSA